MFRFGVLVSLLVVSQATKFMSPFKDAASYYPDTDSLLQEILDLGSDLESPANGFLDFQDEPRESNEYYSKKEIPVEMDYDPLEALNRHPSTRDQEYLRHSTLWSYQRPNQDISSHKIQQGGFKGGNNEKSSLPTYCTPPNPCPVGYTAEDHCLVEFENTAAFSRDFQNAQDCMCDQEHMIVCPKSSSDEESASEQMEPNFHNIVERNQNPNPYFHGEKLPIAAKKGLNVIY